MCRTRPAELAQGSPRRCRLTPRWRGDGRGATAARRRPRQLPWSRGRNRVESEDVRAPSFVDLRRRRPRALAVGAVAVALAATAGALVAEQAGVERVVQLLRHPSPVWLAVCLVGQVLAYAGYSLAYRETARVGGGPRVGLGYAGRVVSAGFAPFLAAQRSGGFAVDHRALRAAGLSRREATARVVGLSALEYAVLAPAALAAAIVLLVERPARIPLSMTAPWLLVVPGAAIALWLTVPHRAERLTRAEGRGAARQAIAHAVAGIALLRRLLREPHRHGAGVLGAAVYWASDILTLWAALTIFHARVSVAGLVVAYATGYALTRRSIPAGGPGVVEVGLTFALAATGVPLATALLGVFAYRLFNFWLAHLPGLAALPLVRELERRQPAPVRARSR